MPAGSVEVRGSESVDARDAAAFDRVVAKAAEKLRADLRGSTVEVSGGTHRRALGFAVDTAAIREQIRSETKRFCDVMPGESIEPLLAEIDSLRDRVSISRSAFRRIAARLDVHVSPALLADAVERLADRADEQADTLKLIADEFAGLVDPANPLLKVRALAERSRKIDASFGLLFGMPIHGRSLNAEKLIEGAKAKLAEVESLDRLGDWLRENMGEHFAVEGIADTAIKRLREGDKLLVGVRADLQRREAELEAMESDDWRECKAQALPLTTALKRIDAILRGSDPADVSEATVIMSAEAADELAVRVAVLEQRVRVLANENRVSARVHLHSLSDALRKIDRISHGVDPAEAMAPVITAAMADGLVVRIGRQFDGFRQLGERTLVAAAELAACEALIHRGFDRLREVDPEFVESLRIGGS
jgi:hypothetical protein